MAEMLNRPEIRKFPVQLGDHVIEAQDVSDAVKQVLWDMREANGWSWSELARQVGLSQQALGEFMQAGRDERGGKAAKSGSMTLRTLSRVLATTAGNNPIAFFARHPQFRASAPAALQSPAEPRQSPKGGDPFERLRELISTEQARELCSLVEHLLSRGVLDETVSALSRASAVPKQRARREKHKNSG